MESFSRERAFRKILMISNTPCEEETEWARAAKFFSVNRSSLIQIPRFSISKFPAAHGSWRRFLCPVFCQLRRTCGCCELGGGLLAITAGALAFFATLYNRRRAQERLRETSRQAEAKFEALAENAQDAIVSADSRGNIIYFNRAAQRAFGYEASEVWANR